MKDVIGNRIKRIEEILQRENVVCMTAGRDEEGFHWNGKTYPDEAALSLAVRMIKGDYWDTPLVIITRIGLSEKR